MNRSKHAIHIGKYIKDSQHGSSIPSPIPIAFKLKKKKNQLFNGHINIKKRVLLCIAHLFRIT